MIRNICLVHQWLIEQYCYIYHTVTEFNLNKFSGKLFGNRAPCVFSYNGFSWTFLVIRVKSHSTFCYHKG